MKKYSFILLIATACLFGWYVWHNSSEKVQDSSQENPSGAQTALTGSNSVSPEARKMLDAMGVFQGKPSRLILDLNKAQDYKLFALNAKNFPSEGGVSYAQYVAGACWIALKTLENKDVADTVRVIEAEKLTSKCSGFDSSSAALEFSNSIDPRIVQEDSFVLLSKKLAEIRTQLNGSARQELLSSLFENPDALLLATESNRIFALRSAASEGGSLYISFGGERHFFNSNPPAIEALRLLPCAYGADCSSNGLLAIQQCLSQGQCSGSYHERVLSSTSSNLQPERLSTIEKFYRSMMASIDAKRVSDFM